MNKIAIKVENLGKKYVINHETGNGDDNFREVVIRNTKKTIASLNPFSKLSKNDVQNTTEDFWALNDVSFEINKGDKVGIIGRNGAGKSTLLKVLSRITEPTTGKIHINGRIASLLEVGTGFHPELTGRENIYLNGAILGMSRREIKSKFDEIVAFAEVEKFLDTPVKRYSSGMYVRLAFSVAAHLEPEILVVDEVLAVGDVEFQKKCLGKMKDVSEEGRTILFVSHNMNAIEHLCDHVIVMNNGRMVKKSDNVREAIHKYLAYNEERVDQSEWINTQNQYMDENFQLTYCAVQDKTGKVLTQPARNDGDINIVIEGTVQTLDKALQVGYALYDEENRLLYWSIFNDAAEAEWPEVKIGTNTFVTCLPKRFLNEGTYRLEVIIALYFRYWIIEPQKNSPSIFFTIQGGLSDSPYWMIRRPGILAPEIKWELQ
ncbi:ABC transporter ATP-binding protein [Sulfurovum sp.]|uniref:ABC transporter ATP-binding protein n=1 Tax=Sulfurovum sp. TaxID=1969726 RepID=UPI003568EAE9